MAESKLGWFPFYPRDWYADPKLVPAAPASRGIWIDLLSVMFIEGSSSVTGSIADLAALGRCVTADVTRFIDDATRLKFADVTECNGLYTIISRRFARELESREKNREKVRRHRARAAGIQPEIVDVTAVKPNVTSDSVSVSEGNSDSPSGSEESEIEQKFEDGWQALPRRAGNNPKPDALKAWRATVNRRGKECMAEMIAGAGRYAVFCRETGKERTELVMQASRFFGPSEPWQQAWDLPDARGDPAGRTRMTPGMQNLFRIGEKALAAERSSERNSTAHQGGLVPATGGRTHREAVARDAGDDRARGRDGGGAGLDPVGPRGAADAGDGVSAGDASPRPPGRGTPPVNTSVAGTGADARGNRLGAAGSGGFHEPDRIALNARCA